MWLDLRILKTLSLINIAVEIGKNVGINFGHLAEILVPSCRVLTDKIYITWFILNFPEYKGIQVIYLVDKERSAKIDFDFFCP